MYFSPQAIRTFTAGTSFVALWEIVIRLWNYNLYFAPDSLYLWMYHQRPWHFFTLHGPGPVLMWSVLFIQIVILLFILYATIVQKQHPRLALFISGILYLSLNGLHQAGLNGGDVIIYTSFLLGSCISPYSKLSYAVGVFQAAVVYLSSASHKSLSLWIPDGTAVYYTLANDKFATAFGHLLTHLPFLCALLTYFTVLALYIAWIGFLIPYKRTILRKFGCILLFILHIGITLTMHVHLIGPIMLVFVSLFWVYSDHHQKESQKVPHKPFLIVAQLILLYLILGQGLYNAGLLSSKYVEQSKILSMVNFHISYFGYKVGYNFFSLDVTKNEWFEIYEPSSGRDVLRNQTGGAGLFTKPDSYEDNVVNARLNRLLYNQSSTSETLIDVTNYFCNRYQLKDIAFEKRSESIPSPETPKEDTEPTTSTTQLLITYTCN